MKNTIPVLLTLCLALLLGNTLSNNAVAAPDDKGASQCITIQDSILFTSDGELITTGFDYWGYNYQGHHFNGTYCNAYRDAAWCQPYRDVKLSMKWNDAWLSKKDCDGDLMLDRHQGHESYKGSGAWITNHMSDNYTDADGRECSWIHFSKIIAVPANAVPQDGIWYTESGSEIGQSIWGTFAIVQTIYNDSCAHTNGVEYLSPAAPGFGRYKKP